MSSCILIEEGRFLEGEVMTSDVLKKAHQARPFQPFTIVMGDGTHYRVSHPEWMSMSQSGRIAIVHHDNDDYSILDLLLMTEVRVEPLASKPRKRTGS